jgi:hypothetical protein
MSLRKVGELLPDCTASHPSHYYENIRCNVSVGQVTDVSSTSSGKQRKSLRLDTGTMCCPAEFTTWFKYKTWWN